MSHRTVFTWNAMIGAFAANGEPFKAIEMYNEMRGFGVRLDSFTFPSVLKACVAVGSLCCGEEVHGLAVKCGFDDVAFVVNHWLQCMRAVMISVQRGSCLMVWEIRRMLCCGIVLFQGIQREGCRMKRWDCFGKCRRWGLYTFVAALQACEESFCGKVGMEIHATVLKLNYCVDIYVANSLLAMYVRCGKMEEAARFFGDLDDKDIVSWNTLPSGFVQNGLYKEALMLFRDMQRFGHRPDQVGNTLIDMYAKCSCVNLLGRAFEKMPNKDFISWTTIIAGYAQNNCHIEAFDLCRKMQMLGLEVDAMMVESILLACGALKCVPLVKEVHGYAIRRGLFDLVLQNAVVNVYGQCGYIDYAYRIFNLIESKDVVSLTSMISCYVHNVLANEALELCHLMKETDVEPDSIALVSILSAAASLSALMKGKEIHGFITRKGFILEGSVASSLVDMYARCGTLKNAYNIYNSVRNKNLILWTTMINAYGMHGHGMGAIDLFKRMQDQQIVPEHITFLALLYACSHSGLIDDGKGLFKS
ncbi:hypothetical protein ACLB2K_014078 [Fragaria x ananassa]